MARVERIPQPEAADTEIEARALSLKQRAIEILRLLPQVPDEMVAALQNVEGAPQLADLRNAKIALVDKDIAERYFAGASAPGVVTT